MRLLRFFISRTFWVQLGLAAVLGLVGFVALNVGLRAYTRHSERIAVPAVVGLDHGGAEVALMAAGLEPVIIDSLYNADGQPGAVVEQDPAAGVEVKGTRNVYLTVYRSTPPSERLEIEEGMDAGVARILLDVKGFSFRERYAPTDDLAGLVLGVESRQGDSLGPDDRLPKGAELVLVIGERTERQVVLPDLVGLSFFEAMTRVEEAGLLPGRWRWSRLAVDGVDSAHAVVSSQLPEYVPGRQVRAGLEIDLDLLLPEIIDPVGPESLFE